MIKSGQTAGTSSYGDYTLNGLFYFEGDDEYEAGWYFCDIYGEITADGIIFDEYTWLVERLTSGDYAGYTLYPYWAPGSTLTPAEPLAAITLPEGVEAMPYVMTYDGGSTPVNVAVDGNDVYFQGMSSYIPEAWVKGTKNGNTVTFPAMQYMGEYGSYGSSYFFYNGETVFTYDAEADTYSASGQVFGVLADRYYDGNYTNPVIKPVVEKAATPANPEITALNNGNYGWYFEFNVPLVDTNGEPLLASKLSYMIYTDIEGEIAPLTFTPDTHTKLTENMTEIPYGFTESYDFYDTAIYLNELYSADWNNLGIQSIYRGGGEENATEIQWYHIKDYAGPAEATFDFNAMDVATSSNATTDGDITENLELSEGAVTLTISPKEESATTANRFWSTNEGPQLRVYSGTLTFEVPEGGNITQIVFNANKWNDGNTADSGKFDGATWTGEAQTVVVTIAGNTQINNIVVTYLSEGGEEQENVLVTLPEGVEPVEYTLTAAGATNQSSIDIEDTKLVAFDGNDVYLQGLAYYFPDAYVKGKLVDNQVVIPNGQFVGEDEYGVEYLVALGVDEEGYFIDDENIIFNYDAESGVLSLVEDTYYGESGTKDASSLWDYFYEAEYTPGAFVLPDVVEAPEGLETETWYLACDSYDGKVRANEVQVGFTDSEVYIQGLCEYLPEAWVKGTLDGTTATFASGQFYGVYNDKYRLFFVGYDYDADEIADVVFSVDKENGILTTDQWILLNSKQNEYDPYDYYSDVVITKEKPEVPEVVEAPKDLVTEPYFFKGFDTYYEEDATKEVQVGFYGDNQVYIQGLSDYIEDAWVVGTLEGNTLTIPETYMGIYESLFGSYELFFSDATFTYDREANTFTSEEGFVSYETPEDEYWMDEYSNVVLTKIIEREATPADPSVALFRLFADVEDGDTELTYSSYPKVNFDIPMLDNEGNPMLSSKLSYVIYIINDANEQKELTLTTDLYEELAEDMTEIPYSFTDDWDIYAGGSTVYLNQDPAEIATWKKIGVQSIYRGLGVENRSNIGWFDIQAYITEMNGVLTGISSINAAGNAAVYFDLQGRKVDAAQKGLLIMQTRQADGTVKTAKVVRK